jgi:TonB family protein
MKIYLIAILSILIYSCHAQNIEVKLINGYNNQPVTDFTVNFINRDGEVVDSQVSDEKGIVTHKLKESVQVVEDKKMKYFKTFPLSISGRISKEPILHYFYPTKEAEKKIVQWEKDHIGKHLPDFSFLEDVEIKEVKKSKKEGKEQKEDTPEEIIAVEEDTTSAAEPKKSIVDYPDKEAQFPKGVDGMTKFLAYNILYPEISMELGDQGKVFIEFVVEKNGLITQVKVLRGVSSEIDAESIRVVRSMPQWSSAESSGELVRARCRIPINYILQ